MSPPWLTLVGLMLLFGIAAVAFVDYEMIRADAEAARSEAASARASCLHDSPAFRPPAFNPAERRQQRARCERLPGPLREAERVERRWERRGPWYGFVAAAIFLPTAAMFAQSRRRRAASPTRDPGLSHSWRAATVAVRLAVGVMSWAALLYLVVDRWHQLVEATGGSTHDCHYPEVDCGVLGEFADAHPLILLSLVVAAAAIPAAALVWSFSRLFRTLDDQPESQAPVGPPVRD